MRRYVMCLMLMTFCVMGAFPSFAAGDPNDSPGAKDPALFSRMTGFYIYRQEIKEFDRFEFPAGADKKEVVEGHHAFVIYYANEGITKPSGLQITRNYVNAAKASGGALVHEFEDGGTQYAVVKVVKGDKEAWAQIEAADNGQYLVHVVEKQLMKQDVVANAEALSGSIRETGRVAVYGIYFDTGKADLKPESGPALAEIVKMLNADPGLKVFVVGHTDTVGQFAANVTLSQNRAAAVVNALVSRHGIVASRLIPFGCGPAAPVASNKTEEGKAKNRRVELVAQ